MARKLIYILFSLLFAFNVYASVELDSDANGATDIDKGGTNSQDGSIISVKQSGIPGIVKLYTADALVEFGSGFVGPDTATENTLYKLPSTDPTVGQQWAFSVPVTTVIDSVSYEVVTISWVDNGGGTTITWQTTDPDTTDPSGLYINTTDGDAFAVNSGVGVSTWATTYTADTTIIMEDDFEGVNGTAITTYGNGWTPDGTDPGTVIRINTAQSYTGSSSMYLEGQNATRTAYNTYTEQTNVTFKATFYIQIVDVTDDTGNIDLADGAVLGVSIRPSYIVADTEYRLNYYTGSAWADFTTQVVLTPATWIKVEIEANLVSDTFSVKVAGTTLGTGIAMRATGLAMDRVNAKTFSTNNSHLFVDDLLIETGAW